MRDKVLLPAFARGVKDPFVATRLAGLRATAACHQHFRAEEVRACMRAGVRAIWLLLTVQSTVPFFSVVVVVVVVVVVLVVLVVVVVLGVLVVFVDVVFVLVARV